MYGTIYLYVTSDYFFYSFFFSLRIYYFLSPKLSFSLLFLSFYLLYLSFSLPPLFPLPIHLFLPQVLSFSRLFLLFLLFLLCLVLFPFLPLPLSLLFLLPPFLLFLSLLSLY